MVSLADTSAQVPKSLVGGGAPAEDHHTSGDSIPVGCEASHLDISGDSGLGSLIRGPLQQQSNPPPSTYAGQEQYRQPQAQENFRPGPESTVKPVEPAKEPTLDAECVEDDCNEITEEESFILNALNRLDQRHAEEMEMLQRRTEEFQRHYMKEKENLRVDLVSTLLSARKMVHQQHETAAMAQDRVQEQKQMIQQLQVVGGLQGQQLVAVQGGPGQPRQQETRQMHTVPTSKADSTLTSLHISQQLQHHSTASQGRRDGSCSLQKTGREEDPPSGP